MNQSGIYQCIEPNHPWFNELKLFGYSTPNSEDYYTIREVLKETNQITLIGNETAVYLSEIMNPVGCITLLIRDTGQEVDVEMEPPFPMEAFRELNIDLNIDDLMEDAQRIRTRRTPLRMVCPA